MAKSITILLHNFCGYLQPTLFKSPKLNIKKAEIKRKKTFVFDFIQNHLVKQSFIY